MDIRPGDIPWKSLYKIMIGSILPRPIGWVSSINTEGRSNLAPFSFFNAVCPEPPHVLFCPMIRGTDHNPKDTLRNVRETGEFVINIVTEPLVERMNLTSTEFSQGISEFEAAGLTPRPSVTVSPPGVAESPIQFECRTAHILDLGDGPGAGSVVVGRVTFIHIDEAVLFGGDKIDIEKLRPVGRLAGSAYCRVTDIFDLPRPPSLIPISDEKKGI